MTKIEAIRLMEQGKKVTHRYFSANEFATIKNGQIVTEEGYSVPMKEFWAYRNVEGWSDGWEEFVEKKTTPSPASGSLELNHAARDYAEKLLEGYDGEHGPYVFNSYAIQQAFLAGAGYSKGGEENSEFEMKRLYDWIMDENRKPAITAFTSSLLRHVAREIEFRIFKQK